MIFSEYQQIKKIVVGGMMIFCGLLTWPAIAQTTAYKFRIRYGNYAALANSTFLINGQQLTTDPQGIISLSIPNQITFANIGSADLKQYTIQYPPEGRANLPKDNTVFVDIYVAKPEPDMLRRAVREITRANAGSDALLLKKLQEESRRGYDSIVVLLSRRSQPDEEALAAGRMEFLPLVSSTLNQYLNEAKDANDAFLALRNSLDNEAAFKQFADAIISYNAIFELLNGNKSTYEQAINTYWKSKELAIKFSNVVDFAIDEIHRPYLLEINFTFLDRIYQYNQEANKGRKKQIGALLEADIARHSAALARRLNILGERVAGYNTLLNNNVSSTN